MTLFKLARIQFVPNKTIICPHSNLPGYKSRSCGRLECAFFVCGDINLLDRKWRERNPSQHERSKYMTWIQLHCVWSALLNLNIELVRIKLRNFPTVTFRSDLMTSNPQWVVVVANQWLVAALDLITNSLLDISYPNRVAVWISILKYVCHVDWF